MGRCGGYGPLAQLAEQLTLNQWVAGSTPARPTIESARVAELADALDLGSSGLPWGFNSPLSHQILIIIRRIKSYEA